MSRMKKIDLFKIKDKELSATLRNALGIFLIFLGVLGIFMVILPGWPFIFLGLFIILGKDKSQKKLLKYTPKRYQERVKEYLDKLF